MLQMGSWECFSQSFDRDQHRSVLREEQERTTKNRNGMEKVGSWIRGSLIGAGAFGKVNLALNRENGDLFAVKSIECNERTGSEMQAMENEVQILQCLDSPYVVKCLGSSCSVENGKSMRNVFIEYMSGGSVADLMKKFGGHFEEPLIRNYTRSILEGIQYLHSQEIVHCDIKGKNVLVGSSGLKLADFGGARRVGDNDMAVLDSSLLSIKGTPLWMAPEVVRQVEQGPASDIWSLGCTVVEMATGKAPWSDIASAANPFVALYHIGCTEEVPDLPSCLSAEGQDFLSKCFQRDPRVRWTAKQLLQHPFVTQAFSVQELESSSKPASLQNTISPTSAFDFPSHSDATGYTSSIVNSVPILRSPLFAKRDPAEKQALNFRTEDALKESSTSSGADFWCNSPLSPLPGQWIVVRSPKATSPSSSSSSSSSSSAVERLSAPMTSCNEEVVSVSGDCGDLSLVVEQQEAVVMSECVAASCASAVVEEDVRMVVDVKPQHEGEEKEEASCSLEYSCDVFSNKLVDGYIGTAARRQRGIQAAAELGTRGANLRFKTKKSCRKLEHWLADARCLDTRERRKPLKFASLRATLRKLASAHRKMALRGGSIRP